MEEAAVPDHSSRPLWPDERQQQELAEEGRRRVEARRQVTRRLANLPDRVRQVRQEAAGPTSLQFVRNTRPRLRALPPPPPLGTAGAQNAASLAAAAAAAALGAAVVPVAQVHPDLCGSFCHAVCLCVLGDEGVGKTALLAAFVDHHHSSGLEARAVTADAALQHRRCIEAPQVGSSVPDTYIPTHGLELVTASAHMKLGSQSKWVQHRLMIWDAPGLPRHRGIARGAFDGRYRPCHGACIVYDVTRRDTLDSVPRWVSDVRQAASERGVPAPPVVVVGAKTDLTGHREVTEEEATALCDAIGAPHLSFGLVPRWDAGTAAADAVQHLVRATHPALERTARRRAAERWTPEEASAAAFDAGDGDAESLPDDAVSDDIESAVLPQPALRVLARADDSGCDATAAAPSPYPEVVILVVGEPEAGCSSLAEVFVSGSDVHFEPSMQHAGALCATFQSEDERVVVRLQTCRTGDASGEMARVGAQAVAACFERMGDFDAALGTALRLRQHSTKVAAAAIIATKCDLGRQRKGAEAAAASVRVPYHETSAKEADGIQDIFLSLATAALVHRGWGPLRSLAVSTSPRNVAIKGDPGADPDSSLLESVVEEGSVSALFRRLDRDGLGWVTRQDLARWYFEHCENYCLDGDFEGVFDQAVARSGVLRDGRVTKEELGIFLLRLAQR